ncbi:MAG: gliding motility lipoprotein GldH [Bacteroidaceae bacterium]|nr:gliding motility lipoprotein GldH [Bacteroidaceae bacterium]
MSIKIHQIVLAAFLLTACTDRDTLIHTYAHVGAEGWNRGDTLTFCLPPTAGDRDCELDVGLRITNRYPYTSLWIVIDEQWEGLSVRTDTVEYQLTDSMGDFSGRGVNIYQYEWPLRRITLHGGQQGRIRLYHIMSRESLPHITEVGVKVKK